MDYVRLAYALLDAGDSRGAVVAFLRAEYGLEIGVQHIDGTPVDDGASGLLHGLGDRRSIVSTGGASMSKRL